MPSSDSFRFVGEGVPALGGDWTGCLLHSFLNTEKYKCLWKKKKNK